MEIVKRTVSGDLRCQYGISWWGGSYTVQCSRRRTADGWPYCKQHAKMADARVKIIAEASEESMTDTDTEDKVAAIVASYERTHARGGARR